MLKAGIYLDIENLVRCGGRGMRYRVVKDLVEAQGATVLRFNAYLAVDEDRERQDFEYRRRSEEYRNVIRRMGCHIVPKKVRRFRDTDGNEIVKANADLDLAVDALLQAENLDMILLGTGDGDFLRLVRALQTKGRRVDLLSFANTSRELREEADRHFNGLLVPGLLPQPETASERMRGILHAVVEEKGFGFITAPTGLRPEEVRDDIFLHVTDIDMAGGPPMNPTEFGTLKTRERVLDFRLEEQDDGKVKAVDVRVLST